MNFLDALVRIATVAERSSRVDGCQGVIEWWHDDSAHLADAGVSLADRAHIAANSPDVTLKLIGRIRELENALVACAREIHGEDIDPDGKAADIFRALVAKGIL